MSQPSAHTLDLDRGFMEAAIAEARRAQTLEEVPIGAVLVHRDEIVARAHNLRESAQDPTGHAEMLVIRAAAESLASWRLTDTTLYVTLEPCAMCAGAIVLARIPRVVFGTRDPKAGACGSLWNIAQDPRLNHRVELLSGVLEGECQALLQNFFRALRNGGQAGSTP